MKGIGRPLSGAAMAIVVLALAACTPPAGQSNAPQRVPAPAPAPSASVAARSAPLIGGVADRFDIIRADGSVAPLPATQVEPYLDLQEARLQEIGRAAGVTVNREAGALLLTMPGASTFGVNEAVIGPGFRRTLDSIAQVLATYQQSYVDVIGHTDSSGADVYNMTLSQRRAESVANYFAAKGVRRVRLATLGRGELDPVASNDTEAGKALNRRVEIRIVPITQPATS
ncbi:OmpA family protein [Pacificimonas flava]|nr:OmpA family protein [Pacificimonas flava]MBB5280735.1 outer membrane protein OmpA-like peptidoglycan-associated protein [Pacificimonas flava]